MCLFAYFSGCVEVKDTNAGVRLTEFKSEPCDQGKVISLLLPQVLICKMKRIVCSVTSQDYCEDKRSPTLALRTRCDTAAAGIVVLIFCMYNLMLSPSDI